MSLLQSIVTEVIKNAAQSQTANQSQSQAGLGGLLGGLAGAMGQGQSANQGMGGVLGNVLGSVLAGQSQSQPQQSQGSQGLDAILGGLLGGQSQNTNASAGDLGSILGSVLGGSTQGTQSGGINAGGIKKSALLVALLPVVLAFIQKNGGLSGVLGKFSNNGMGNQAQSWVNIDANNDGIDAGDIQRLFGDQEIQAACAQTGASESEVCQDIAELLPKVVNDLTPQGDLSTEQEANDEISQILAQINASKF